MDVPEFRSKIKSGIKLSADGIDFVVKEVIRFRFDDGSLYIKCYLSDGYVFADDSNENIFLLVKETKTEFQQPFQNEIYFEDKKFRFLYNAHAVAEEIFSAKGGSASGRKKGIAKHSGISKLKTAVI